MEVLTNIARQTCVCVCRGQPGNERKKENKRVRQECPSETEMRAISREGRRSDTEKE